MEFVWDIRKERSNRRKHGIGFREAATVFDDLLSTTVPDPNHSQEEDRFLTIGMSATGRILVIAHTEHDEEIGIITASRQHRQSGSSMKKGSLNDEMRKEYDFSSMRRGSGEICPPPHSKQQSRCSAI